MKFHQIGFAGLQLFEKTDPIETWLLIAFRLFCQNLSTHSLRHAASSFSD